MKYSVNYNIPKPEQNDVFNIETLHNIIDLIDNVTHTTNTNLNTFITNEGLLSDLLTTNKTSLVNAINEIYTTTNSKAPLSHTHNISDVNGVVENKGDTPSIQSGLDVNKPQPTTIGALYLAIDTKKLYRANGVNWVEIIQSVNNLVNADMVDGKHASDFANAIHTHTKANITDFAHTHNINEITNLPNERFITICTSTTRPSNPVEGQHIYETDTKKTMKWTGNVWQGVGYEDFTPPATITNFTAVAGIGQVTLNWTNPTDNDFSKVKIVRKTGYYPTSHTDGTVVYEGTGTSYVDTRLTGGTTYYYRAFTFDILNNINSSTTNQQVNATTEACLVYGVRINKSNSNPLTSVEYTDDAVGFTPASGNNGNFQWGSWQDKFPFKDIKPCVLKSDGTVNYYLNPNDFTKKIDGSTADITSGNDGDVMIEFPKVYWYIYEDANYYYVKISNAQVDSNYKCLAHTKGANEKDKIYIGAYLGWYDGSKLRSLSGKTPTGKITIGTARNYAQARAGWEQFTYYRLLMLQCLYIIMFKSLDSQTALGRGYVDGNISAIATGGTNNKGMFYGETTGKQQMKFCGIEDLWGNCFQWTDGIYIDSNRNILLATTSYNDTGSGYANFGQGSTNNIGGYINTIQGTTEKGFIAKSTSGSATTYFCDYGVLSAGCLAISGGNCNDVSYAGCFKLDANYPPSFSISTISARCCFVG